jgi:hypothetical protein
MLATEDLNFNANLHAVKVLEDVTGVEASHVGHQDRVAPACASRVLQVAGLEGWHRPCPHTIAFDEWSRDYIRVEINARDDQEGDR